MGWSIPVGTVKGTVIRIHITFLLFLVWIAVSHYAQGGRDAAIEGTAFVILLFLCVLLHEFGHVFAARRYGVQTPDITLLPIGGVARLERIPEEPRQELIVALAGPAVNVVIAAILFLALGGFLPPNSMELDNPGTSMVARLAMVNVFLVVFNLIPAFPMDGGRVLRAILASRLGYQRGTQVAATVGQVLAFGLGFLGLVGGNPILVFIAIFVYFGAAGEAHAVQMRQVSRSMLASDAMITRFESLRPGSTVEEAVQCLIHTTQHDFPIVDGAGILRGVLTRDDMIRALRDHGPGASVLEAMRTDIPVVHHRQPLDKALQLMQENRSPAIGVVDGASRLVGLITPENVGEMMMVLAASPPPRPPMPWQRIGR
ncbi:MAG TPA: site-2 protease family protein [Microvirga sp.]|nr:site-2 protease family protein [Microvirga sp.]